MKSLGDIFRAGLHHHIDRGSSGAARDTGAESPYLLLGQKSSAPQARPAAPSRQEILNYLGELADEYRLPRKLVYALADAESTFQADRVSPNYAHDKHGHPPHDKRGNPIIKSTDYGVMQINSSNIDHGPVKDAHGHPFKIGDDVKTDWKANARAGVALLAPAYRLAELEQGPGATAEDHAQQAYSQYNGGQPRMRDRYLRERRDGMPQDGADRNFLEKYRQW
jgi:hypothetical protein